MSTVSEVENAVQKLSRNDLTTFRNWFLGFDDPTTHGMISKVTEQKLEMIGAFKKMSDGS